jgi:hypothetical protein
MAAVLVSSLAVGSVSVDYDVGGQWLIEGGGFAEKGFVRAEMTLDGTLDIQTQAESGDQYVQGFTLAMRLDATRLNINTWKYSKAAALKVPVKLPELRPTTNEPFELPAVPVDDLTVEVTFTSTTSGTVKINGYIDVDVVGQTEIQSESAIWKEGTPKPDIPDRTSGCNGVFGGGYGAILAVLLWAMLRKTQWGGR